MCSWCKKTFTQKSNVGGCHINTHTGEAPHKCQWCGDRFKDPSKRHKHQQRCSRQPHGPSNTSSNPHNGDGCGSPNGQHKHTAAIEIAIRTPHKSELAGS
ncbi:hypothetical protein K488DRAFT_40435 [Vararia minispora EC-137]|uniref:Uncharacterized protein n=1 Tax=Vararia minispora EC-137 TaxID=1314806 RepID=A0ACB8QXV6_9AGAM|nr:hypothetical protein K488DRAFT_40435 [Vararia minispora EC-137]